MCLIIAPGADGKVALLPEDVFNYAYGRNNDGFGAMWTEDGRVKHLKVLGLSAEDEYAKMKELTEQHPDVIFHMRLKTHGAVIPSLCHPFRILHKERHGKDLFFMHNGVLSGFNNLTYGQSDTTAFKDKVLIPILTRRPDALDDPSVMESINKITSGSRLIFLDSDGKVYRTSESTWNNRYDLTLSNSYMLPSLPYTGRTIPSTNNDNVRRIGGGDGRKEGYNLYRTFRSNSAGQKYSSWCKQVVPGLIRTEYGTLYRDLGPNIVHDFSKDFVPAKDELNVIMELTEEKNKNVLLDDDVPAFEPDPEKKRTSPAPEEERLRYARIVHNCNDGTVVSRAHMLADLISMGNKEMLDFVKEDPENTNILLSELIEMVVEYNDVLMDAADEDPTIEGMVFPYEELTEMGSASCHQMSMKEISDIRKQRYADLAEAVAEMEEAKKQRKVA